MNIINFNSYYNHILDMKLKYETDAPRNLLSGSLVFKLNEMLNNYDFLAFEKNKDCLLNQEEELFSYEERLVLFLLYCYDFEKILNCDCEIRCALVESFLYTRLNPYHYDYYLDMFLNPFIFKELEKIEPINLIFILDKIIELYDINLIKKKNFDELKRMLCKLNNTKYSMFDENYNLLNIYNTLKEYMLEERFFNEKDFENLDYLLALNDSLDDEQIEEFKERISLIEEIPDQSKYDIAINALKIIKEYYIFSHLGMKLIRTPKEMEE